MRTLVASTSLQWVQNILQSSLFLWTSLHAIESPHVAGVPGHLLAIALGDTTTSFVENGGRTSSNNSLYSLVSRYSVLPAMSLDGILHLAIQDQPFTAIEFNSFIEALLGNMNPFPLPNSVIIMDNASIHKSPELQQMIEDRFVMFLNGHIHG